MLITNFIKFSNYTPPKKFEIANHQTNSHEITQASFQMGSFNLFYENDFEGTVLELYFLNDTFIKNIDM